MIDIAALTAPPRGGRCRLSKLLLQSLNGYECHVVPCVVRKALLYLHVQESLSLFGVLIRCLYRDKVALYECMH